jgi:hypothetical protein
MPSITAPLNSAMAVPTLTMPVGVVLGCPRSGTTFLMRVLNTLPNTACLTGIAYPVSLPQVIAAGELTPEVRDALVSTFPAAIDRYLHSGLFNARAPAVQKWRAERGDLSGLRRALKGERHVERFIYKEPFLSFAPELVLESLPEAPVVYLLRDGRDVANSLVRSYDVLSDERLTRLTHPEMRLGRRMDHRYVPWWVEEGGDDDFLAASPYVRAVWMWKAMVERCETVFASEEAQRRVFLLRYEDFMREPVALGEQVIAHLGAASSDTIRKQLQEAHVSSIGSYRKRDPKEVAVAEQVAGETLARFGYS